MKKIILRNFTTIIAILFFCTFSSKGQNYIYDLFPGDTAALIVKGSNSNDTIQWQKSSDSSNWTNISGATTNPYYFIPTVSDTGRRFYRAKFTNATLCNNAPWYSSIIRHKVIIALTEVHVGDWFRGGIVFFKDSYGHCLIAPIQNQSNAIQWGCTGTSLTGSVSNTDGEANTPSIIVECATHPIAASICDTLKLNGYSDWYLPAIDELNYLYLQKNTVDGFGLYRYWSSTQNSVNTSKAKNFSNGIQPSYDKYTTLAVRCIRDILKIPTITTTAASSIRITTATSGGNVTNGGATVTQRGVCWDTLSNPTIENDTTVNGTGTGTFTSSITGLILGKTYFVRAYATNSVGTGYGDEYNFTTTLIGQSYQGGIIAYILQPGDPGYIAGQTHGLIAAPFDQGFPSSLYFANWWNGSYKYTGASGVALGTGNANTNAIVASQGAGSYAAKLCYDLVLGGYSDWYLPSYEELYKLYLNKAAIGGFVATTSYYSSSEWLLNYAVNVYFSNGTDHLEDKQYTSRVRAVRSISLVPILTTTTASSITNTTATSGGNVTSEGAATITARGVCWNTSANPTTTNNKTTDSTGTGTFSSSITGLTTGIKYHIRAYATNSMGTAYGNDDTFTSGFMIGRSYQGGIIGYILQSTDPGYVVGQTHGLIVAPSDQSTGIQWYNGNYTTTGATATSLGTGNANTNSIIISQGYSGSYAAKLCYDLVLGGYSDWYLPSIVELNKISLNRVAIGGFNYYYSNYWSSTEKSSNLAVFQSIGYGYVGQFNTDKHATNSVRAVRSF